MQKKNWLKICLTSLVILSSFPLLSSCSSKSTLNSYTLCDQLNTIIDEVELSGEKEEIEAKWYSLDDSKNDLDYSALVPTNGTIKVGVSSADEPMAYLYNNKWTGLCFDYIYRLCKKHDYSFTVSTFSTIGALITAASTGKIDIATGSLSITEERAQSVGFSKPFFDNEFVCIKRNSDNSINDKNDLAGKQVGVLSDAVIDQNIERDCPTAIIKRFNNHLDIVTALENGQIDAAYLDSSLFRFIHLTHTQITQAFVSDSSDKLGFILPKFGYQYASELYNKKVGIIEGSVFRELVNEHYPSIAIAEYKDTSTGIAAMQSGKIDAVVVDAGSVSQIKSENSSIYRFLNPIDATYTGAIFPKTQAGTELKASFDAFITSLKNAGEVKRIFKKWENYKYGVTQLEEYEKPVNPSKTIKVSVNAVLPPYCFYENGKMVGIDIDLLNLFSETGYNIVLENMDFNGLIPSLNKNDMGMSCISITEQRAESVNFSVPIYSSDITFIAMAESSRNENIFTTIENSFEKTFIRENRWKLFVEGASKTLLITFVSIIFGLMLGFILFFSEEKYKKIGETFLKVYSAVLTRIPVVVVLMIFYYIFFAKSALSGTIVSIIVFTLTFSASTYSMLKTSIMAIDKGQYEAAYSLGYSKNKAFFKVIMPQTLKQFIPLLKDEIVTHLKATAIVGYVAVEDLTKMSDIIRSRTYESFFPLIVTALIYFLLTVLLIHVVKMIDKRVDPKKRKSAKILKGVKQHD